MDYSSVTRSRDLVIVTGSRDLACVTWSGHVIAPSRYNCLMKGVFPWTLEIGRSLPTLHPPASLGMYGLGIHCCRLSIYGLDVLKTSEPEIDIRLSGTSPKGHHSDLITVLFNHSIINLPFSHQKRRSHETCLLCLIND